MSHMPSDEKHKKMREELDLLRKSIEKFEWAEHEEYENTYHATLTEPPFKGWRLVIQQSRDKWDQGSYDYWTIPSADGPYAGQHKGGHGIWEVDEAEILILKHLIELKKEFQNKA